MIKYSWFVLDCKIVLHNAVQGVFGTITQFVWVSVVCEVGMVGMDDDVIAKQ